MREDAALALGPDAEPKPAGQVICCYCCYLSCAGERGAVCAVPHRAIQAAHPAVGNQASSGNTVHTVPACCTDRHVRAVAAVQVSCAAGGGSVGAAPAAAARAWEATEGAAAAEAVDERKGSHINDGACCSAFTGWLQCAGNNSSSAAAGGAPT